MSRTIKTWLLLLSLSLTIFSCEKEYSIENGGLPAGGGSQSGTAKFTFDGAPGGCTTPSILGTYKAGTALTAAEKVTLIVEVTEPGTYTISTATFNGISFAGSGTFSATGQQFIELTAVGSTPTAAGTFSYIPGTAGCSFSITYLVSSGSSSGTAVYTLDGAPNNCQTPVISGTYTAGVALTAANTVKLLVTVNTPGTYTITTGTANGIKFTGSGTFAAAGPADITLTGEGTPVDASLIQYTPGGNGCSFNITTVPGSTGPGTGDYFRVKIDGVLTTFNVNLVGDPTPIFGGMNTIAIEGDAAAGSDEHLDITVNNITAIAPGTYLQPFNTKFATSRYYDPVTMQGYQASDDNSAPKLTVVVTSVSGNRIVGTFSAQYFDLNGTGTNSKQFTNGEFSVPY